MVKRIASPAVTAAATARDPVLLDRLGYGACLVGRLDITDLFELCRICEMRQR
jgi:hypothetical protein